MAKDAKKGRAGQGRAGQGRIKITQIGSPIGRRHDQRETLIGLGLNKINRARVLEDTAAVRGMVEKVSHLVKVEPAA